MKQVVQNYRSGELALLEVPVPACRPGGVLVRSLASLVSAGTEAMKIDESRLSLVGKARARPDQVKKVLETASQQGVAATYRKVSTRLDSYTPLGYSLCGEVVEVGEGVTDLAVGDRVACAGNRYALHAEFNFVPRNLCVAVPDGVPDAHAAFTTVGAIAMQGYRQSEAQLGEVALVIGLGLVGQLLVQLLHAGGVTVLGLDPSTDRCRLAEEVGAVACGAPGGTALDAVAERLRAVTAGAGADHVFITAGGDTNQPVEVAVALARDRARVVDIGKTRLDLPWKDYYAKEIDVRFSRSYGPGRYDPAYEEGGADYPIGYVRWTEGRNMASFVDLLAQGRLDLDPLVSSVVPFDEAVPAYERLLAGQQPGVGLVFSYRSDPSLERRLETPPRPRATSPRQPVARIGVIGAGNYATSMLLPHLRDREDAQLVEVATATSLSAVNAQRRFGFERCTTDYRALLEDDSINAVLIATRHDAHAAMVCDALISGKTVFVEKPLAVDEAQLARIIATVDETGNDRVVVGFNRRYAPLLTRLRAEWAGVGPVHVRYDVNAGRLDTGSWYGQAEHGARLVGEGCHFVDTASWWIGADPVDVFAVAAGGDPDDATMTVRYADGSVATIGYLTRGDPRYPKELFRVSGRDQVAALHNFRRAELWRGGKRQTFRGGRGGIDKGQGAQMAAFVDAVTGGGPLAISFSSLVATTRATLAACRSIASGEMEPVSSDEAVAGSEAFEDAST